MKKCINALQLKTIAFGCLILLNLAWCGLIKNSVLQFVFGVVGSVSIPLFLYVMNESLKHTRSITKYMLRVLLLSVISAIPYYILYTDFSVKEIQIGALLSSPFTLFYCIGMLALYKKIKQKHIRIVAVVFFVLTSWFIGIEWAPYATILAFILHACDDRPNYRDYNVIMFFTVIAIVSGVFLFMNVGEKNELIKNLSLLGILGGVPLIRMYNGEEGLGEKGRKVMKICFYVAYPGLLVMLLLVKFILVKA